jgi:hypothetical protein
MSPVTTDIETAEIYRPYTGAHWGAIFAGWVFSFAIAAMLYVLGSAVGITAADVADGGQAQAALGTGIWVILSWAGSLYIGGMLASRLSQTADPGAGTLQGMCVWGLTCVVMIFLGITGLMQAGNNLSQGMMLGGSVLGATAVNQEAEGQRQGFNLEASVKDQIAGAAAATGDVNEGEIRRSLDQINQAEMGQIAAAIRAGDAEGAKNRIAQGTNLERGDVDRVYSGFEQQLAAAGRAADKAADYSSAALWTVFATALLGLIASALGGASGARRVQALYGIREVDYSRSKRAA